MPVKEYESKWRYLIISAPEIIQTAPGIKIFGRVMRSFLFTTDVALIKNSDADAIMALYPFTPQPAINQAIITATDIPVMCSIGGSQLEEQRAVNLATEAEFRGAVGGVLGPEADNDIIAKIKKHVDIPLVVTIVSDKEDVERKIECGADILNISGAENTCKIIERVRNKYPYIPIIATGGPKDEDIKETIDCGADAITYTPPTNAELFKKTMQLFRENL